jgi:hypothetical protein
MRGSSNHGAAMLNHLCFKVSIFHCLFYFYDKATNPSGAIERVRFPVCKETGQGGQASGTSIQQLPSWKD